MADCPLYFQSPTYLCMKKFGNNQNTITFTSFFVIQHSIKNYDKPSSTYIQIQQDLNVKSGCTFWKLIITWGATHEWKGTYTPPKCPYFRVCQANLFEKSADDLIYSWCWPLFLRWCRMVSRAVSRTSPLDHGKWLLPKTTSWNPKTLNGEMFLSQWVADKYSFGNFYLLNSVGPWWVSFLSGYAA